MLLRFSFFAKEKEQSINSQNQPTRARRTALTRSTVPPTARHGSKEEARPRHVLRAAPATTRPERGRRCKPTSPPNGGAKRDAPSVATEAVRPEP